MRYSGFGGLTLGELARRVWKEANEDNVWGGAAQLAYYFLLSLFPMLIFLISLVGFIPDLQQKIMVELATVMPPDAQAIVSKTVNDVVANRSGGLLSFGLLASLWAGSSGAVALMTTLSVAYEVKETRSFWLQRVTAIGLTILLSLLVVGGTGLIMFGDRFSNAIATGLDLGLAFRVLWGVFDYLIGLALTMIGMEAMYYFGPNLKQDWRWITPGAVFAVVASLIASVLFSLYLKHGPSYSATYGSLGAVIILMLWLYLIGIVQLLGGEINSEIEKAAKAGTTDKSVQSLGKQEVDATRAA